LGPKKESERLRPHLKGKHLSEKLKKTLKEFSDGTIMVRQQKRNDALLKVPKIFSLEVTLNKNQEEFL